MAKGDVGIGTIVGSAVFNVLVIIGLCAILCDEVPKIKPSLYQGEFPCFRHFVRVRQPAYVDAV